MPSHSFAYLKQYLVYHHRVANFVPSEKSLFFSSSIRRIPQISNSKKSITSIHQPNGNLQDKVNFLLSTNDRYRTNGQLHIIHYSLMIIYENGPL